MTRYIIEKELRHHVIEWVATFLSIFGVLLVTFLEIHKGYWVWTVANILWISFALKHKHYGMLVLSVCYLLINIASIIKFF